MKKFLVLCVVLFVAVSSSYAFSYDTTFGFPSSTSPQSKTYYVYDIENNIATVNDFYFYCVWYPDGEEYYDSISGSMTISDDNFGVIKQYDYIAGVNYNGLDDNEYGEFYNIRVDLYASAYADCDFHIFWSDSL